MRITRTQQAIIISGVRKFIGDGVEIHLFGSRLDDSQQGGDVDLLLMTPTAIPQDDCENLKTALEEYLKLPVKIVTYVATDEPTPSQASLLADAYQIN